MEMRLDHLLGRAVVSRDGRRLGRIEEFRVARDGDRWEIIEYETGASGLWDRLGLGARLVVGGKRGGGYRIRWDQLSISEDGPLRITCSTSELQRF